MRPTILMAAAMAFALAGCGPAPHESASGTPDAADTAVAEAPASPAEPTRADPSAKDVQVPGIATGTEVSVGPAGYGDVRFGMSHGDAERAAGGPFGPASPSGGCDTAHTLSQPDVQYVFGGDKLQRIEVHTPGVMADGGGRVGMDADEIRTLYGGKLSEKARAGAAGRVLEIAKGKDAGIAFVADESGKIVAFRAGNGAAAEAASACVGS